MKSFILSVFLVILGLVAGNSQVYKIYHSTTFLKENNKTEWEEIYSTPVNGKISVDRSNELIYIEGTKNLYLFLKEVNQLEDGTLEYVAISGDDSLFVMHYKDYVFQTYFKDKSKNAYIIESNISSLK